MLPTGPAATNASPITVELFTLYFSLELYFKEISGNLPHQLTQNRKDSTATLHVLRVF